MLRVVQVLYVSCIFPQARASKLVSLLCGSNVHLTLICVVLFFFAPVENTSGISVMIETLYQQRTVKPIQEVWFLLRGGTRRDWSGYTVDSMPMLSVKERPLYATYYKTNIGTTLTTIPPQAKP